MYVKKMSILFMVLMVCLFNLSYAQEVKQVTFKGTVFDDQGKPVAGAKAKLYKEDYGREKYSVTISAVLETTTNADGTFSFEKNTEGDDYPYGWIVVEKEGLALDCSEWVMREDKGFEFKLGKTKELSGIVVDENDKPVEKAKVSISIITIGEEKDSRGQNIRVLSVNVAPKALTANTDETGKFTFKNLPGDSRAEFSVQKEGKATADTFKIDTYPREPLQFSPGQDNIKIVLLPESAIEGIVVDGNTGKPVAGINLLLRQGQNNRVSGQDLITSKEDGTFKINCLAENSYRIIYASPREGLAEWVAQPVNVNLKKGQLKKDIKIELSKGGFLDVHVIEAGSDKSLTGATVNIYNNESKSQKTDKNGIARIRLLPGVYQSGQVYMNGYTSFRIQDSITIEEGRTKHLDLQLSPMPKAGGVVLDDNGKPVKGAKLCVLPGGGRDIESDADGKFNINWDMSMFPDERENPLLVCRYEEKNLAAVVILEGTSDNLDIKLKPGITVRGKVADPNGKGIKNADIGIMLRQTMWASTFIRNDSIKTDNEGNFEVKAIPAEYKYQINTRADGYGSMQKDVNADNAVNNILDAGNFTLALANLSVSGVVVDAEDNPIPNARIESYNFQGGQPDNLRTQTDSQGKFILKGVCEGKVDIRVNAVINGITVSARASADGGASDIKIIARERGQYVTQRFDNKSYDQILQSSKMVIAGVVVDEKDSPVAGVPVGVNCIKRERKDAPGKFSWTYSSYENLSTTTDKQGRFAIELEEDAQYDLIFSPFNHAAMIVYDIPAGKKDLMVGLEYGGTISGQLVRMDNGKKVPIANVQVKLEQTDRASYTHLGFDRDRTTITDSEGRFNFEHIQTKIRQGRSQTELKFAPRVWQLVYGQTTKTFAFYDKPVIDDFEILIEPDLTNPQRLTGRALPELEAIKTDFDIKQAKEKSLLICFFDIEQRPSRSCILLLSQKASQLRENNIEVIVIHASKVEQDYLNNWLKENNISFPVGIVEKDEEQARFNWGVKALPWLILTDKEHTVTAEGFSINELDKEIQK